MKKYKIDQIKLNSLKTMDNKETWANAFQAILEKPKLLSLMSMEDLIWHYFKSNILMYKPKKTIRSKIRHQLKIRFKLPSLDHITMKLPTNNYNRKTMHIIVRNAILAHTAIPVYMPKSPCTDAMISTCNNSWHFARS